MHHAVDVAVSYNYIVSASIMANGRQYRSERCPRAGRVPLVLVARGPLAESFADAGMYVPFWPGTAHFDVAFFDRYPVDGVGVSYPVVIPVVVGPEVGRRVLPLRGTHG